jgi:beta-phosphoglucomutase-like phosphatase (HAD superfamily)
MQEANDEGILIGICTTSNEKAVKAIVNALLADVKIDLILAGDVVAKKKPDPEIYTAALQMTRLSAHEALVIEDSENGLLAGKAAGINVLVTVNDYTRNENLTYANAVLSSLGDANEPAQVLSGYCPLPNDKMLHINNLIELL